MWLNTDETAQLWGKQVNWLHVMLTICRKPCCGTCFYSSSASSCGAAHTWKQTRCKRSRNLLYLPSCIFVAVSMTLMACWLMYMTTPVGRSANWIAIIGTIKDCRNVQTPHKIAISAPCDTAKVHVYPVEKNRSQLEHCEQWFLLSTIFTNVHCGIQSITFEILATSAHTLVPMLWKTLIETAAKIQTLGYQETWSP